MAVAILAAIWLAGCGSPPGPTADGSPVPAASSAVRVAGATDGASGEATGPGAAGLGAAGLAQLLPLLDPGSRDLLALIEPEEAIEATIDVAVPVRVAAIGRARGLDAQAISPDSVVVIGARDDVVAFAAGAGATQVTIAEDHRPDRWLPAAAPPFQVPIAGLPYRLLALPVDRTRLHMTADQADALLGALARRIVTIDGRPYDRLAIDGECESGRPPVCTLRASGVGAGVGDRSDDYLVVSNETTAGDPRLDSVIHQSVPRDLRRAAEWIARHDPAAGVEIARETGCCGALWDPVRPGVITMIWTRPCSAGVPTDRLLAGTGDCEASLSVVVDVGRAIVVSIARAAGP